MDSVILDFTRLVSVEELVTMAPALTLGTIRHWLFHRNRNALTMAVLKVHGALLIDIDRFNIWLSLDKDDVSDFRDLRTKQQILENSFISPSRLEDWLRHRRWNGLEDAVIKKGERRLLIDTRKFNKWLLANNSNPQFAKVPEDDVF